MINPQPIVTHYPPQVSLFLWQYRVHICCEVPCQIFTSEVAATRSVATLCVATMEGKWQADKLKLELTAEGGGGADDEEMKI